MSYLNHHIFKKNNKQVTNDDYGVPLSLHQNIYGHICLHNEECLKKPAQGTVWEPKMDYGELTGCGTRP